MYFTSSISVRINVNMHSYLDNPACSIFAHRGGSIESYENTIESFNYAVDLGCEYIETDVQLSSDGVPYIFHDDDLHRFIGKKLRFNDLNSNELNEIKLFDRFSIPTLEECMETFPNTKFNIDLKTNEVMKPAMKYLDSINAHSRVCIASFSDQRLDFVKKNYYIRGTFPHTRVAGMQGFVLNQRNEIFLSRKVRAAVAMVFDFEWSNKNLFYGQYKEHLLMKKHHQ